MPLYKEKQAGNTCPERPLSRGQIIPALIFTFLITASTLSAEPSTGISVLSGYYFPVDDTVFQPGLGTAVAFDLMPYEYLVFFGQGEYLNIGLENLPSFSLTDGSLGAGLQKRLSDRFSIRGDLMAGVYSVKRNESAISGISGGARVSGSYHFSPSLSGNLHTTYRYYAYTPEPFMISVSIGAGISVNLREAFNPEKRIRAEVEKQYPVFPVLYSWYDSNHFSEVKVTNDESNKITDVTVSFYLEKYMGQPKICKSGETLLPGESFSVPLTAFFNEAILELSETIETKAKIIVEYKRLGSRKKAEITVTFPVFHRNAMSWDDDRRAAAFVSPRDPASLWFSRYVSGMVSSRYRNGINKNIQYAMGMFETLNIYGINYVIDPSSSYAELSGSNSSVDFLQYPYQTLMYRGGDCDDLSILYCSLLESTGIDTAFITIPGHIYMAFSTGMTESEAKDTFIDPDMFIYRNGVAWVPVEITILKEGFNKAWRVGLKEWKDADARGNAMLYPMKESWKLYRPVSIPGAVSRFNLPDEETSAIAYDSSLDVYVEREIRPMITRYREMLATSDSADTHNRLGVLYARYGMIEQADAEFKIAAAKKDNFALTNLGNVYFLKGQYREALSCYSFAISSDAANSVAMLGMARCYYELDDFRRSDSHYASLAEMDSALAVRYGYLGSFFDTTGRAWSFSERLSTTTWSLKDETVAIAGIDDNARKDKMNNASSNGKGLSSMLGLNVNTPLAEPPAGIPSIIQETVTEEIALSDSEEDIPSGMAMAVEDAGLRGSSAEGYIEEEPSSGEEIIMLDEAGVAETADELRETALADPSGSKSTDEGTAAFMRPKAAAKDPGPVRAPVKKPLPVAVTVTVTEEPDMAPDTAGKTGQAPGTVHPENQAGEYTSASSSPADASGAEIDTGKPGALLALFAAAFAVLLSAAFFAGRIFRKKNLPILDRGGKAGKTGGETETNEKQD